MSLLILEFLHLAGIFRPCFYKQKLPGINLIIQFQNIIMRLYFSFLVLCVAFNSFSQVSVTVLTYNIYHGELAYQPGKPNLDSVASLINRLQPDFVACQEVDSATGRSKLYYGKKTDYIRE